MMGILSCLLSFCLCLINIFPKEREIGEGQALLLESIPLRTGFTPTLQPLIITFFKKSMSCIKKEEKKKKHETKTPIPNPTALQFFSGFPWQQKSVSWLACDPVGISDTLLV